MWKRKFYEGKFQHFYEEVGIACFKDESGWKFRFINSVECNKGEFNAYVESVFFWKSLTAVKKYVENTLHSGGQFSMIAKNVNCRTMVDGYKFIDGKFRPQAY